MAFGILEPKTSLTQVPGTTFLDDEDQAAIDHTQSLKKGTGRNAHVILIPQPSNDPNDPLNWPLWQRDLVLVLLSVCTLLTVGGFGPILSPISVTLITEFGIDFTQVSLLSGCCLCATGAVGVFMAACCRKFGKRPGLLFSMATALIGCVWAGAAKSYGSFLGARVMQGMSMAFFESVMFAVIGDMYYVHERGTRVSFYITMFSGISNLPMLTAGKIDESLGWRWIFWLLSIFVGVCAVLCVLFSWETSYNRDTIYEVDNFSQENLNVNEISSQKVAAEELESANRAHSTPPSRISIWRRMAPWSGNIYTEVPLWRLVLSPLMIIINPAAIWATSTIAFPVLWIIGVTMVIAQIFSAPPYLLTPAQIGYMSAGPVVSGILANLFCAFLSDWSAKWFSRRNGGKYEPEFRLFLIFGLVICSALGYYLFGYLISQSASPVTISVAYAIAMASAQFSAVTSGTYVVDAYRAISVDIFIVAMIFKNFLFFGFSYFVNDWVASQGPRDFFYTIGGIQLGLCCLTIPFYVYGKRLRAWWHIQRIV